MLLKNSLRIMKFGKIKYNIPVLTNNKYLINNLAHMVYVAQYQTFAFQKIANQNRL